MEFYVGWSHSDAYYCDYFSDCPMLISAIPGNQRPLRRFQSSPSKLIVDSGAILYDSQRVHVSVKEVWKRQLSIIEDAKDELPITLVQLDQPLLNKTSLSDQYAAMEKTLFNAYEYMKLFQNAQLPTNVRPMGVIQAFDFTSAHYAVHELSKMGYDLFGIGSLLTKSAQQQIQIIEQTASLIGADRLHVFGVTGMAQIRKMAELGIRSFDSTRPTMTAAYFQVFYSDPFRTYVLDESRVTHKIRRIKVPLPCDCPVCLERPDDILICSPRNYMKLRSIHNYYHLRKEIQQIQLKKAGDVHAVPDVLWAGNRIHI